MTAEDYFSTNTKLAYYWASRAIRRFGPKYKEEIRSAAMDGLWRACLKYRATAGKFGTYSSKVIRFTILSRLYREDFPPDEEQTNVSDVFWSNVPAPTGDDRQAYFVLLGHKISDFLNKRHKAVIQARMTGRTLRDVAKEMRVTGERVRQIEREALKRLRKFKCLWKGEYFTAAEERGTPAKRNTTSAWKAENEENDENPWRSVALRNWEDQQQ